MTENARKRKIAEMEARDVMDVREDASRYLRARLILSDLREKLRLSEITWQQYSMLRGQALAGDVDGAVKGLARVLRKRWEEEV